MEVSIQCDHTNPFSLPLNSMFLATLTINTQIPLSINTFTTVFSYSEILRTHLWAQALLYCSVGPFLRKPTPLEPERDCFEITILEPNCLEPQRAWFKQTTIKSVWRNPQRAWFERTTLKPDTLELQRVWFLQSTRKPNLLQLQSARVERPAIHTFLK